MPSTEPWTRNAPGGRKSKLELYAGTTKDPQTTSGNGESNKENDFKILNDLGPKFDYSNNSAQGDLLSREALHGKSYEPRLHNTDTTFENSISATVDSLQTNPNRPIISPYSLPPLDIPDFLYSPRSNDSSENALSFPMSSTWLGPSSKEDAFGSDHSSKLLFSKAKRVVK
eukprot:Sdes_comp18928_c2_seq1m9403